MKALLLLVLSLIGFDTVTGQSAELYLAVSIERFKKSKDAIIQVGLSTDEVKAKIGNPKAVQGGFPKESELLIWGYPNMVGQMNHSTWFYVFEPIDVALPQYVYYVNGLLTDELTFNGYKGKREVYFIDGKLISQGMGDSYKKTRSSKLIIEPLDNEKTYAENTGGKAVKMTPLYCVIFDKGTQVVAATLAYFTK